MKLDPRLSPMEKVDMGTGLAPRLARTMPTRCQISDSSMMISVMPSKDTVYGSIKAGFVSGAATEPIVAKAISG